MTPGAKLSSREEEAIRSRVDDFAAAWNRHDPHAMSMGFAEDGDLINPFGLVAKSRAEVEKLVAQQHAGPLKTSHMSIKHERVRMLGADVAIADCEYEISGARDPSGKEMSIRGHLTHVLKKQGDSWLVVAARPMVPLPRP